VIYAYGCSHSSGMELLGSELFLDYLQGRIDLEDMDDLTRPMSWPNRLAEFMGVVCCNRAMSGGSNTRTIRKIQQDLPTYTRDTVIIVAYTEPQRTEFYYPDQGLWLARDRDNYIQVGVQWYGSMLKSVRRRHPINDYYVEQMLRVDDTTLDRQREIVRSLTTGYRLIEILASPELGDSLYPNYVKWCAERYHPLEFDHYGIEAQNQYAELLRKGI